MEDEKEGDKVPDTFQRFWRESPEGSINFTALEVSFPLPIEAHSEATPLTYVLLFLKSPGLFGPPLVYPMRTGTLEMIGQLLSFLTLQKGVSVLNGRLTQTYFDEDQLYWTYFQF